MTHDGSIPATERRNGGNGDRRRSPYTEKRSSAYNDRREKREADLKQLDTFACVAYLVYLFVAVIKPNTNGNGKVDFNEISRMAYMSALAMMKARRDFSRKDPDEEKP